MLQGCTVTVVTVAIALAFACLLQCVGTETTSAAERGSRQACPKSWTADNGNGTYSNPLFYEEFEDPDVIRVGEDYYLAGTTMHMNPGLMVMHSRDMVNWQLASYCIDRLDLGPAFRLEGGNIYGQGIWAPCIRYHDGTFYVLSNVNGVGTQVFRSKSPNGPWARNQLPGMHDLSVLFDDDGKVYAVYGARRPTIVELNKDLTAILPDTRRRMDAQGMGEGHHLYKIKGKYFDVSAIPGAHTDQVVARADSIDGPWQVERMVHSECLGVPTQNGLRAGGRRGKQTFTVIPGNPNAGGGLTLHQGGIVDTPSGEWWSIIMQDHGSVGRMVALVPVTWDNNFPIIGLPGNLRKAPNTWVKPNTGHTRPPRPPFVRSDNFDSPRLNPVWQWNHVPDDTKWSLTEKRGVLRLHSLPATDFWTARNSLTQRPPGPECVVSVELDASSLVTGDTAGLALLSSPYAWIGLVKGDDGLTLQTFDQTTRQATKAAKGPTHLWLQVACNFDTEKAVFSWSADGKDFSPLGEPFTMVFQLTTFQGVRLGLFNYNISGKPGGHADFDNFTVDEPRAAGIERAIPLGKTVTLTSGADGSVLAMSTKDMSLVSVPPDSAIVSTPDVRFQVIDLGRGRVALKASNGRFVSAGANGVALRDLAGAAPGEAESFQWVNLMRGDTMLMSLVNHRYLTTQPSTLGPVMASAVGPRPDRKGGACFKWKAVE
ncbi:MAG: family 43 glycosylhydrolase [Phycisphaerae bacterium]